MPSWVPSATSDGTPRMVEVMGATVRRERYGIALPLVTISTVRSLSGSGKR